MHALHACNSMLLTIGNVMPRKPIKKQKQLTETLKVSLSPKDRGRLKKLAEETGFKSDLDLARVYIKLALRVHEEHFTTNLIGTLAS